MILVTGATGNTGREIARLLQRENIEFRCLAKNEESKLHLESNGLSVVLGDFDEPSSLASALDGVDKAYLVCTPDEKLEMRETNFIKAALRAQLGHLVKLSALHAAPDGATPNLRAHGRVEAFLKNSGLPHTCLKPNGFLQTLFFMAAPLIESHGILMLPGGSARAAFIDVRDVAAAAVKVLTATESMPESLDLTGPSAVSFAEMASSLSKHLGRSLVYVEGREGEMVEFLKKAGVAEAAIEHVVITFGLMRQNKLAEVSPSLELLNLVPRTLDDFSADLAAGRTGSATSFKTPILNDSGN